MRRILFGLAVALSTMAHGQQRMTAVVKPMSIGEAVCGSMNFLTAKDRAECVRKHNEPFTLPDLKVHGIAVTAGRYDASGFVRWDFAVQTENVGGTQGLPTGQMPVYTHIFHGRVCPQDEYCPSGYEGLIQEHHINIPRPGELATLSFSHRFHDPDGSGTIPKSLFVLLDSRYGGADSVPGMVTESNEYNNQGWIDFKYVENGSNQWTVVYP